MKIILLLCSILFGSALVSGCASLVVSGQATGSAANDARTPAEQSADADITYRINAAYVDDPVIPAMDIRVSTYRGVVTLRGALAEREAIRRAVALAKSTRGVKRVRADLQFVPRR
jgi:hyperosmotically inducible protein